MSVGTAIFSEEHISITLLLCTDVGLGGGSKVLIQSNSQLTAQALKSSPCLPQEMKPYDGN